MAKKTTVLLTWDDQGTSLVMARIEADPKQLKILKTAHSLYINASDVSAEQEAALSYINSALADPASECYYEEAELKAAHGIWHSHLIDMKKPFAIEGPALAIYCGFAP